MEIIEAVEGGVSILSLKGRLDATTSAAAEAQMLACVDRGAKNLVIDLEDLDYISSAGLRVFLVVSKRLSSEKGSIALCSLQSQVREIFDIAGFTGLFAIASDRASAVAGGG
jgi:anti-anti-sigma factor